MVAVGMRVLVHDPFVPKPSLLQQAPRPSRSTTFSSIRRRVFARAAPGRTTTCRSRELGRMKPDGNLINTARASVLDYGALIGLLQTGKLAGAGLDVFPDEPLSSSSPLLDLPNVTLTPHIGGASTNVVEHHSEIL